ncbi:MAG: RNA polymerase factor sigma-54 [Christensenella sp.]|nr:RNA polymerase factor sigma-54 [Christensenella sp.]
MDRSRMQVSIGQKQIQSQTMHQQMQQALRLLHMNALELNEYISEAVTENPVLQMQESELPFDVSESYRIGVRKDFVKKSNETREYGGFYDAEQPVSMRDKLLGQIGLLPLKIHTAKAAKVIIQSLDDRGYLVEPLAMIAKICHVDVDTASTALRAVQSLEPAGIGARNLIECLKLQLERKEITEQAPYRIIKEYLPLLAKNNIAAVAAALGITKEQARRDCDLIKSLRPMVDLAEGIETPQFVYPEILVEKRDGQLLVAVDEKRLPKLIIDKEYRAFSKGDAKTKAYLTRQYREARKLVNSLGLWKTTLQQVAEQIVSRQAAFFLQNEPLEPLLLVDLSESLGVSVSTVSRAVAGKYLICERGIFALKTFLVGSLTGKNGCKVSKDAVKTILKGLFEENSALSDEGAARALMERGIVIARRTVAKYRADLGIQSVYHRGSSSL